MQQTPNETGAAPRDPALALLKWLVVALTAVMLVCGLVLMALFVTRFPAPAQVPLPETVVLPDGGTATAFTRGPDWIAVVVDGREIVILDVATGALRQRVRIIGESPGF